ncbi:hypothetical protein GYB22_00820 [bacterium]|nr:hypothetical protein [bacterium]
MLPVVLANAQDERIKVDAVVYSLEPEKPLAYATVSVLLQEDSTHIAYGLTDKAGLVTFDGLKTGQAYNFLVFYLGYEVGRVPLFAEKDTILDTIWLASTTKTIEELVVTAERPPLMIRNDTMEFNASAFKTLPDALVEDLLNKLPGVDKDENGDLMVNGKKVTKLLVDGKQFFGSDPAIALKNLPADAIDKVQITSDKEYASQENATGEEDETVVINLTIKKGMKKGYFGKIYAGGGMTSNERGLYETGGIINMFRDTFQVSVLGFGNNTNKQAFNYQELNSLGGFDRAGINRWSSSSQGTQIGNVSVGGATQGFNNAAGGGININHNLERSYLNFQYFYGGNKGNVNTTSTTVQSFTDSVLTRRTITEERNSQASHNISAEWEFDKDTLTQIELRASHRIWNTGNNNLDDGSAETQNYVLYESLNASDREYSSQNSEFSGSINKLSRDKKFNHYLNFSLQRDITENQSINEVYLNFLQDPGLGDSFQRQLRLVDNYEDGAYLYGRTAYDITDSLILSLSYRGNYSRLENVNRTLGGALNNEVFDSNLSNRVNSQSLEQQVELSLTFVFPKVRVTPEITLLKYDQENTYGFNNVTSEIHDIKFLPGVNVRAGDWHFNYRMDYDAPDVRQLNPLLDNSNLTYNRIGNPDLQAELSHRISIYTSKYDPKTMIYKYVWFFFREYATAITQSQQFLESGTILESPLNVNTKREGRMWSTLKKTWSFENKNKLALSGGLGANYSKGPTFLNSQAFDFEIISARPNVSVNFFLGTLFEISELFSYNYRNTSQPGSIDLISTGYTQSTAFVLRWPKRVIWRASFDFNLTQFNNANIPENRYSLLNADIFYNVDEKGKWQLNLKAYDILGQNQSIQTWSDNNYLFFRQSTVLQQYLLLSVIYNIKSFKGTEVNARDRSFWWW